MARKAGSSNLTPDTIMAWDEDNVEKIIRRYVNCTALTKALIEQMNEAGTKAVKPAVKL